MDRIKCPTAAAAIGITLLCGGLAQAQTMLIGSVYDVPGSQLVVAVSTELVDIGVDRATPCTINGQRANIADLEPGDHVRVTTQHGPERTLVAVEVTAIRRPLADPLMELELSGVE